MTQWTRMTIEFEDMGDIDYTNTLTALARLGVDIVDEETFEVDDDE